MLSAKGLTKVTQYQGFLSGGKSLTRIDLLHLYASTLFTNNTYLTLVQLNTTTNYM